jgi:WD40 repeat protein
MAVDPNKLKKSKEFSAKEIYFCLARVPGGARIFAGASDFNIYDFDAAAEKFEPKQYSGHNSYVTGITLARDSVISGSYDGRLIWWNPETGEQIRSVDAHQKWIRDVRATPDESQIVSVADDMACKLWDAESGALVKEFRGHAEKTPHNFPSMLYCSAVSPDGKHVATADKVGHVIVWEIATGNQAIALDVPVMYTWDPKARIHSIGGIRSLAFSPDGKQLAVGGMGQVGNIDHLGAEARVAIFDWQDGKSEPTHEFHDDNYKGLVEFMAFDPEGKWLLAAGGDHSGFVQFFDLASKKAIKQEKAPMHIHDIAISESFDTLYAAGHGKLVVWELPA